MKKNKNIPQIDTTKNVQKIVTTFSPWNFCKKIFLMFLAVLGVIIFTDRKGYFAADQSNNHIKRKWASFYNYTKTKEVDVLVLGNSHVITGIDPFVFSNAVGSTCFILGNSGTGIIDAWFQLGEALKYMKPKLVILETYCINNDTKPKDDIIPYLQSFEAQKNVFYKLQCMPQLFNIDHWLAAWSPSIRNHSFLLTDTARINFNKNKTPESDSIQLDLGRFARFNYGLQDSILKKYDSIGAPVDGKQYSISSFTKKYLQKIMELCENENIPVLFLTVPMYNKHLINYDKWKSTLKKELVKYSNAKWCDLQMPFDTLKYTPAMFENTYSQNQHLTNQGMIVTSYKVAGYINTNYPNLLPDRSKDPEWVNDFMNTPHYIFNQEVPKRLADYTATIKNKTVDKLHVKELIFKQLKEATRYFLKIEKTQNLPAQITVQYRVEMQGAIIMADVKMFRINEVDPVKHDIYVADLRKDVSIQEIEHIRY